ncbi:ABC transporter ATP-binding protein [Comamonas testosteroni]
MARISLDLAHAYRPHPQQDSDYALLPLQMEFADGGAYALLGPSGCGKTTLLNIMSGLLTPSHGKVLFDGRDVTQESPQQRNIAQVFQFPVIYDTMTVEQNLAFPLRNRNVPEAEIRKRVGAIAEMLEMSGQLNQRAAGLSADAKQKISLGRGLVRPDVAAVLFDEPLTVIDPHLKWQLRRKLKQIHQEFKLTLIYVTHDQVEALTFAEQVVVMSRGRVMQVGAPEALFERPSHTFVGHFIGSPGMNFLPLQCRDGAMWVAGQRMAVPAGLEGAAAAQQALHLGIRPEYMRLAPAGSAGAVPAQVQRVQDVGTHMLLTAAVDGKALKARFMADTALPAPGATVWLEVVNPHTCYYRNEELMA